MQKQDERAVESMVKCGLSLEAVYESFPKFNKSEIEEIYNRIKLKETVRDQRNV